MKFNVLPFGLLNQAVIAGLLLISTPVSANPLEILQQTGPPPQSGDTFHKSNGEVLQLIDLDLSRPVQVEDDEEYIDQDESDEWFADDDNDVMQFQSVAGHGAHEDLAFVNDFGKVEVEEFLSDLANRSLPGSPLSSHNSTDGNFTRDFPLETNSTAFNLTRGFAPEVNGSLADNSTALPDGEEESEGFLDGFLNLFENLFHF